MDTDLEAPRKLRTDTIVAFVLGAVVALVFQSCLSQPQPPSGMASFVAGLTETKATCESTAASAIGHAGNGVPAGELANGQVLYSSVKIDVDVCIARVSTGLVTGLTKADLDDLEARLKRIHANTSRFIEWSQKPPPSGRTEMIAPGVAVELLLRVFHELGAANAQKIEQLRQDISKCRLRDWNELRRPAGS
jgi:hypothetical protein